MHVFKNADFISCEDDNRIFKYLVEKDGKKMAEFDYDFCKGCGVCADICPKKDIEMVPEEPKQEEKKEAAG